MCSVRSVFILIILFQSFIEKKGELRKENRKEFEKKKKTPWKSSPGLPPFPSLTAGRGPIPPLFPLWPTAGPCPFSHCDAGPTRQYSSFFSARRGRAGLGGFSLRRRQQPRFFRDFVV